MGYTPIPEIHQNPYSQVVRPAPVSKKPEVTGAKGDGKKSTLSTAGRVSKRLELLDQAIQQAKKTCESADIGSIKDLIQPTYQALQGTVEHLEAHYEDLESQVKKSPSELVWHKDGQLDASHILGTKISKEGKEEGGKLLEARNTLVERFEKNRRDLLLHQYGQKLTLKKALEAHVFIKEIYKVKKKVVDFSPQQFESLIVMADHLGLSDILTMHGIRKEDGSIEPENFRKACRFIHTLITQNGLLAGSEKLNQQVANAAENIRVISNQSSAQITHLVQKLYQSEPSAQTVRAFQEIYSEVQQQSRYISNLSMELFDNDHTASKPVEELITSLQKLRKENNADSLFVQLSKAVESVLLKAYTIEDVETLSAAQFKERMLSEEGFEKINPQARFIHLASSVMDHQNLKRALGEAKDLSRSFSEETLSELHPVLLNPTLMKAIDCNQTSLATQALNQSLDQVLSEHQFLASKASTSLTDKLQSISDCIAEKEKEIQAIHQEKKRIAKKIEQAASQGVIKGDLRAYVTQQVNEKLGRNRKELLEDIQMLENDLHENEVKVAYTIAKETDLADEVKKSEQDLKINQAHETVLKAKHKLAIAKQKLKNYDHAVYSAVDSLVMVYEHAMALKGEMELFTQELTKNPSLDELQNLKSLSAQALKETPQLQKEVFTRLTDLKVHLARRAAKHEILSRFVNEPLERVEKDLNEAKKEHNAKLIAATSHCEKTLKEYRKLEEIKDRLEKTSEPTSKVIENKIIKLHEQIDQKIANNEPTEALENEVSVLINQMADLQTALFKEQQKVESFEKNQLDPALEQLSQLRKNLDSSFEKGALIEEQQALLKKKEGHEKQVEKINGLVESINDLKLEVKASESIEAVELTKDQRIARFNTEREIVLLDTQIKDLQKDHSAALRIARESKTALKAHLQAAKTLKTLKVGFKEHNIDEISAYEGRRETLKEGLKILKAKHQEYQKIHDAWDKMPDAKRPTVKDFEELSKKVRKDEKIDFLGFIKRFTRPTGPKVVSKADCEKYLKDNLASQNEIKELLKKSDEQFHVYDDKRKQFDKLYQTFSNVLKVDAIKVVNREALLKSTDYHINRLKGEALTLRDQGLEAEALATNIEERGKTLYQKVEAEKAILAKMPKEQKAQNPARYDLDSERKQALEKVQAISKRFVVEKQNIKEAKKKKRMPIQVHPVKVKKPGLIQKLFESLVAKLAPIFKRKKSDVVEFYGTAGKKHSWKDLTQVIA